MKELLRQLGLDVDLRRNRPFGVDWADDIAYYEPRPALVLDVGANVGQTASRLTQQFPAATLHCFEPMPSTFKVLQERWGGHPHVRCHQLAFGSRAGVAQMLDGADSAKNTLLTTARPGSSTVGVQVSTLDIFSKQLGISNIDILKIDTEGFEGEVLKGASDLVDGQRIRFIVAECDFALRPETPHGDFRQICELLQPRGYRVVALYCHGVNGNGWGWGDVLFMLPSMKAGVAVSPFR